MKTITDITSIYQCGPGGPTTGISLSEDFHTYFKIIFQTPGAHEMSFSTISIKINDHG